MYRLMKTIYRLVKKIQVGEKHIQAGEKTRYRLVGNYKQTMRNNIQVGEKLYTG